MDDFALRFLHPQNSTHRKYEALRALFVEGVSLPEAAHRFGYAVGTLRNLRTAFLRDPGVLFFLPDRRGKPKPSPGPDRDGRIAALRKAENLSAAEIAERLTRQEKLPVSEATVARVLKRAGFGRLRRRRPEARGGRASCAAVADQRELDLRPRRFRTEFGGLFLFAHDLAALGFDRVLEESDMPGSAMIPPGCAFRALLALKLWGIGRPSHITPETLDEGMALFAGLNAVPKRSTLTEYSCRVDPRLCPGLMDRWHAALHGLDGKVCLGGGHSFDLDFHTIPCHGDEALIEKHYVSKRSRRQRGVLAFLARDADARVFVHANAQVRKKDQTSEILHFAEAWRARTGALPKELIFDSRLTTYANLARLNEMDIRFATVRRRSARMVAELQAVPDPEWRRIALASVGRAYRNPRILDRTLRIRDYPEDIRQIAVKDLGHEKPTLLLTNQLGEPAASLIDRYARRMIIENAISDAIDFFHMDALSAAVPMKVDLDIQLTLIASGLYRVLAKRLGNGFENARARTLFRNFVRASAGIRITENEIIVSFGRRAHNPCLLAANYARKTDPIPWLQNRRLQLRFF